MHKRKVTLITLVISMVLLLTISAWADAVRVISYGADLSKEQKDVVYNMFGLTQEEKNQIAVTEVSNKEEREYLKDLVEPKLIGSKAISSAYVEVLGAGEGITVQTQNITWVKPEMYANALTTAQVKDAKIIAVAPFPVSGTAALTGIFKAFEAATGKSLDENAKDIANEEMVRTGQIAQSIEDPNKATELIIRIKEEVIKRDLSNPQEIREVIINISNELNINLTEVQVNQLVELMQKINGLNLQLSDINTQLKDIKSKLDKIVGQGEEVRGIIQMIADLISRLVAGIMSLFGI